MSDDPRIEWSQGDWLAEVERLEAEVERLRAENKRLREALERLQVELRERTTPEWLEAELYDAGTEAKNCVQEAYEHAADRLNRALAEKEDEG